MHTHDESRDQLIAGAVDRAVGQLLSNSEARMVPRFRAEKVLITLAAEVKRLTIDMARLDLMATARAAAELGITPRRVRALAAARGLGWQTARDWIFTPDEVELMRTRTPGRPPKRRLVGDVHRESLPEIRAALENTETCAALGTSAEEVAAMSDAEVLRRFMIFDDNEGHREVIPREE